MTQQIPPPPRHVHLPLTDIGELIVELDVATFRLMPERRFLIRSLIPDEFDRPLLAGDRHGKPHYANAIIVDRTRPRQRVAAFIACGEVWPTTDREILAFMRQWGCAI